VKNFMVIGINLLPPPAVPTVQYFNQADEATITGSELELRTNLSQGITGFVNYTCQTESREKGTLDPAGNPIEFAYAPKNKFNVGSYFGPFHGVRGSVEYAWRGEYTAPRFWYLVRSNFTDPAVHPLPSYGLLNAKASYDLPFAPSVRVSLLGQNLTNERPVETLIGVDTTLTGRQYFAQVEWRY
jgi:outer membrane receptor protein involved in Fe transport